MQTDNLGHCSYEDCTNEAMATRKGDDKPFCWNHITILAKEGTLSVVMPGKKKRRYDPTALRKAIEDCDSNIEMFEQGIITQNDRKEEYWKLLEEING